MSSDTHRVVLFVDDSPRDTELALSAFEEYHLGNEVVVARDGAEALDYLFRKGAHAGRSENENPALVLLDINLPRIDGLEVLRRMRADPRTKLLPVVILTSSKEEQDLIVSYSLGANSYVRKPVDFDEFIKAARQLGLYWLLLNENPPPPGAPT
jgi:two-component system response regulator